MPLEGKYIMKQKSCWIKYDAKETEACMNYAAGYMDFISRCKTERECTDGIVEMAKKAGYRNLKEAVRSGRRISAGEKLYHVNYGKTVTLFLVGGEPLEKGMKILGAHIDSPRVDLKPNPLYEQDGQALLDTRYYGGIKKYQWLTLPLAMHGVVAKKDGSVRKLSVGEADDDPVLYISDILPHVAQKQMEKKARDFVDGEAMNVLAGGIPVANPDVKEPVKEYLLGVLKEKYDMEEEDFLSAELELVPAGRARSAGLDASFIAGYGQDDRVCAYSSAMAMLELEKTDRTCACVLVDKEEIGSAGATGMTSRYFENSVAELMALTGDASELGVRRCLENSEMLSSDVSAAFDPNFSDCFEPKNSAYLGCGLGFNKYTGGSGKSSSNDAGAEFLGKIRAIMDHNHITWQMAELGKVDLGGGGTIAKYMAAYNMRVIDSGVPVLSMHAPCEIVSKADVYEAKKGYLAFLREA